MNDRSKSTTDDFVNYETLSESRDWIPLHLRERLSIPHLIGICCVFMTIQCTYTTQQSLGSPILKKLNFSEAEEMGIWSAGPICGLLVQPVIGFLSDRCTSKLGRRRPFIICGSIGVIIGLFFMLAIYLTEFKSQTLRKVLFVMGMFMVTFFLNTFQGPSRALIGDLVPQSQQILANTIGSIMMSTAAIIASLTGSFKFLNIPLDEEKSRIIVFGSGISLISITVPITVLCAKEERLQAVNRDNDHSNPFSAIFHAIRHIPQPILRIALVYFFSWMAYFPFLLECTDFFASVMEMDGVDYEVGLSFGMLVLAVLNTVVLVYSLFQDKLIKVFGLRPMYAASQIIEATCLISVTILSRKEIHISNKNWLLMALVVPLGISFTIFNSVPFAIVGLNVKPDQMGVYMACLNVFCVVGQQIANLIFIFGVQKFVNSLPDRLNLKSLIIGPGAIFAITAAILCKWIILPQDVTVPEPLNEPLTENDPYY